MPVARGIFAVFAILGMVVLFQNCSKVGDSPPENSSGDNVNLGGQNCATSSGAAAYFPCSIYFNQDISAKTLASYSATVISALQTRGWGAGRMQVDFSIDVYYSTAVSPATFSVARPSDWFLPDSDQPATIPASPAVNPAPGFESGNRNCNAGGGGDCHYIVMDVAKRELIELWSATVSGNTISANGGAGGLVVWPFDKAWASNYRGDTCTSADAAGLMIAPLLFSADEIYSGRINPAQGINHAIRFIIPNASIAAYEYVRPATHTAQSSGPISGATMGVPYGSLLRLKNSGATATKVAALKPGAQVVARGMQKFGMYLADAGNIALTAMSDAHTAHKYADAAVDFSPTDLSSLQPSDFEVIAAPSALPVSSGSGVSLDATNTLILSGASSLNCVRNP